MLRAHRMRLDLTQEELARRAGLSVRALRTIERGGARPRDSSLRRLAAALELSSAELDAFLSTAGSDALWVGVLGPFAVRRGGVDVDVRAPMPRALLGLLALHNGRRVSYAEIVEVLWGEDPPRGAVDQVRVHAARLRSLLEPDRSGVAVVHSREGYLLADARVDLGRFDELVGEARAAADPERAFTLWTEAVACWRGPVLADAGASLREHPAAVAAGRRRLDAVVAYADVAFGLERYDEAVPVLRDVAVVEPLHEGVHARLMLSLAGAGEQAAALAVFNDLRTRLAEELGVEPGADVRAAHLRVLRQEIAVHKPSALAGSSRAKRAVAPAQLPADIPIFVGRAQAMGRLDTMLSGDRASKTMIVISAIDGMAGVGKTALAVHWSHQVRDRFPDGQLYVDLRGHAARPALLPIEALARLLHALEVAPERVPAEVDEAAAMYRSNLADKRILIVLDNARDPEQVLPLLPGTGGSLVIVTSRNTLTGLVARTGAVRLALDRLTEDEASALLVEILGKARTVPESAAIAELARLCDHLPLALRIAGARLAEQPGLDIADYNAQLRASPLAALSIDGDPGGAVSAAFDLSYSALSHDARRLFRFLGLVPGPDVSPVAAAALIDNSPRDTTRLLDRLASAHLIHELAPGRYSLHDLLRSYAVLRAGEEDTESVRMAALQRLYDCYLRFTDAAARLLHPQMARLPSPADRRDRDRSSAPQFGSMEDASAWLDAEHPNLVAAVTHAAERGPRPVAWLLADALRGYFLNRMRTVDWTATAHAALSAAQAEGDHRAHAAARLNIGGLHWRQARYDAAVEHLTEGLALARRVEWQKGQATALGGLGHAFTELGELERAIGYFDQALAIHVRDNALRNQAIALTGIGTAYWLAGQLTRAVDFYDEALELYRRADVGLGDSGVLGNLGEVYHALGHIDKAIDHQNRFLALTRSTGHINSVEAMRGLAAVHRDVGSNDQALDLAQAALTAARDAGYRRPEAMAVTTLASIHCNLGRYGEAIEGHHMAIRLAKNIKSGYAVAEALIGLAIAQHRACRPEAAWTAAQKAFDTARKAGHRLLEGQAMTVLATLQLERCRPVEAAQHAEQALAIHRETGHRLGEARSYLVLGEAVLGMRRAEAYLHWETALDLFTAVGAPESDHVKALLAGSRP